MQSSRHHLRTQRNLPAKGKPVQGKMVVIFKISCCMCLVVSSLQCHELLQEGNMFATAYCQERKRGGNRNEPGDAPLISLFSPRGFFFVRAAIPPGGTFFFFCTPPGVRYFPPHHHAHTRTPVSGEDGQSLRTSVQGEGRIGGHKHGVLHPRRPRRGVIRRSR